MQNVACRVESCAAAARLLARLRVCARACVCTRVVFGRERKRHDEGDEVAREELPPQRVRDCKHDRAARTCRRATNRDKRRQRQQKPLEDEADNKRRLQQAKLKKNANTIKGTYTHFFREVDSRKGSLVALDDAARGRECVLHQRLERSRTAAARCPRRRGRRLMLLLLLLECECCEGVSEARVTALATETSEH